MLNQKSPTQLFKVYVNFSKDGNDIRYSMFLDKPEPIDNHVNDWLRSTEDFSPVSLRDYLRTACEGLKVYTKKDLTEQGLRTKKTKQ